MDWQMIETAPKDGRKVLLADYSGYAARGDDGMWITSGYWSLDAAALLKSGYWVDGIDKLYTPTHWAPLPAPPARPTPAAEGG